MIENEAPVEDVEANVNPHGARGGRNLLFKVFSLFVGSISMLFGLALTISALDLFLKSVPAYTAAISSEDYYIMGAASAPFVFAQLVLMAGLFFANRGWRLALFKGWFRKPNTPFYRSVIRLFLFIVYGIAGSLTAMAIITFVLKNA